MTERADWLVSPLEFALADLSPRSANTKEKSMRQKRIVGQKADYELGCGYGVVLYSDGSVTVGCSEFAKKTWDQIVSAWNGRSRKRKTILEESDDMLRVIVVLPDTVVRVFNVDEDGVMDNNYKLTGSDVDEVFDAYKELAAGAKKGKRRVLQTA